MIRQEMRENLTFQLDQTAPPLVLPSVCDVTRSVVSMLEFTAITVGKEAVGYHG